MTDMLDRIAGPQCRWLRPRPRRSTTMPSSCVLARNAERSARSAQTHDAGHIATLPAITHAVPPSFHGRS